MWIRFSLNNMNIRNILCSAIVALSACFALGAQEYVAPAVEISKEKVKFDGKLYYSHVVVAKQTLYSISKAYEVSIEELYQANESIHLREIGLKENSILLIPVKDTQEELGESPKKDDEPRKSRLYRRKRDKSDTLSTPTAEEPASVEPLQEIALEQEETAPQEEMAAPTWEGKNEVEIALMLPLKASGSSKSNSNYMDFYSGALLAARDKGLRGINVNLSVYDVARELPLPSEQTDVVIGPVFSDNVKALLGKISKDNPIVSPLDSKSLPLVYDNRNLIQVHGDGNLQYADLARWMAADHTEGGKVLLLYEKGKDKDVAAVEKMLSDVHLSYAKLSYNILEGRNITPSLQSRLNPDAINQALIVSDSEAFVNDAVRNLAVLTLESSGSYPIVLYGPSKIKNFETIETENLHNLKLHLSTSYHVDYDDTRVRDFLMQYRALYKSEPTAFAYQGYDLTYFFVEVISKYGDSWKEHLSEERSEMLQTSLHFERVSDDPDAGLLNTSYRHVVYGPDYEVSILK